MRMRMSHTASGVRLVMDEELAMMAELFIGAYPILICHPSTRQASVKIKQGVELNRFVSSHHSVYDRRPPSLHLHNSTDDHDVYKDWLQVEFSHNDRGIGSLVQNVHLLPAMTMTELEIEAVGKFEVLAKWPTALTPPRRRRINREGATA